MTTDEQKEVLELRRKVSELYQMQETAKLVVMVQDQNQNLVTNMLRLKQRIDSAFSLINTLQVLERDKKTINQLKTILAP